MSAPRRWTIRPGGTTVGPDPALPVSAVEVTPEVARALTEIRDRRVDRDRVVIQLWCCPDGHWTSNPSPIPGHGDDR